MVFEQIRQQAIDAVPFARLAGVVIDEVARGRSRASLQQRDEVSNHVGTLHAAALFALGEAASGAAMAGALAPLILQLRPVASEARIRYLNAARGLVRAEARVPQDPDTLVQQLREQGRLRFEVQVALSDAAGEPVAEMTVEWHARLMTR
ncbi:PaaI family thioesterase [Aquabacterium sp.]|uniref:PaaI family thioesterase n=1 Tax=Aquabacterium sp. TaxID=1872578 RepID=UPI0037848E97